MGDGELPGVGECEERAGRPHGGKSRGGAVMKMQVRRAAVADDFDAPPEDPAGVAGAERFHRGFLGGKPGGKRRGRVALASAVRHLPVGEHPVDEAVAVALDRARDPGNLRGVEARTDDVHSW